MESTRSNLKALVLILLVGMLHATDSIMAGVVAVSRSSGVSSEASTATIDYDTVSVDGVNFGLFDEHVESEASTIGTNYTALASASASQQSEVLFEGSRLTHVTGGGEVHALANFAGCHPKLGSYGGGQSSFSFSFQVVGDSSEFVLSYLSWALNGNGNILNVTFDGSPVLYEHHEVLEGGEVVFDSLAGNLGPGNYVFNISVSTSASAMCGEQEVGDTYFGFAVTFPFKGQIEILDGLNTPMANTQFRLSSVSYDPPNFTETDLGTVETDSTGKFPLPESLEPGDSIKISKVIYAQAADKHQSLLGTMYSIQIDNAQFDSLGKMSYTELLDSATQTIKLDHTTIAYNFVVSVEWDAAATYQLSTRTAFRHMSNYLYDITDGQTRLDTVLIFDNHENWNEADFQIHASNIVWPHVDALGGLFRPAGSESDPVEMPRYWAGNEDDSRNLVSDDALLTVASGEEFRTRLHEFSHYGLTFDDEYVFVDAAGQCATVNNYGFMYSHYEDATDPMTSEMSNANIYALPQCQNTAQWDTHSLSCWDLFESDYEGWYGADSTFAKILMPQERMLAGASSVLIGPNDDLFSLDYDVGAQVLFPGIISAPAAIAVKIVVQNSLTSQPLAKIAVGTESPGGSILSQGMTADNGELYLFGASASSIITASGVATIIPPPGFAAMQAADNWFSGTIVYDGAPGEIVMPLRTIAGSFPFNLRVNLNSPTQEVNLDITTPFSNAPILKHLVGSDVGQSNFDVLTNGYSAAITGPIADVGEFRIEALDASDSIFFVGVPYAWHSITSSGIATRVSAHDGSALLEIDAANLLLSQILIASSRYPVLRNSLDPLAIQGGAAQTLAFSPNATLEGSNELTIRYFDSDLQNPARGFGDETSLRMHFWNSDSLRWELVGGSVDTAFNEVTAHITEAGVYAAFTTADINSIPCGDANGSGQIDIADAVYMINYIFASGPAPVDFSAGDFNCSGSTDIVDAVFLINYIFASGSAPCAACP